MIYIVSNKRLLRRHLEIQALSPGYTRQVLVWVYKSTTTMYSLDVFLDLINTSTILIKIDAHNKTQRWVQRITAMMALITPAKGRPLLPRWQFDDEVWWRWRWWWQWRRWGSNIQDKICSWNLVQLQDHSRGNLNYTTSPAHHLDYRFQYYSKIKTLIFNSVSLSLESLAEEYTDEPSIGWKRRRRSEEIL